MKKILILLFLVSFTLAGTAQQKQGFFKPLRHDLFQPVVQTTGKAVNPSLWLFRPTVEVTAVQLNWNKVTKQFDASTLSSAGLGVSYAHFIELPDGSPYNNFSLNALFLLGSDLEQVQPATTSIALTGSFLNFINIGGVYNISKKSFGILTGVVLKF